MIETFRSWLFRNQSLLGRDGITFDLSPSSEGLLKNGVSAVLKSERFEVTIELWETGESEFYFLDWEAADRDLEYQPEVVHHDFSDKSQMFAALEQLVSRMSPVMA